MHLCVTFVTQYGYSNGEEDAEDVEKAYSSLQCPLTLTLSTLSSLLKTCNQMYNLYKSH